TRYFSWPEIFVIRISPNDENDLVQASFSGSCHYQEQSYKHRGPNYRNMEGVARVSCMPHYLPTGKHDAVSLKLDTAGDSAYVLSGLISSVK
ncbi:hypothetical protein BaRGS_00007818, partial [Batillaria attramentaria]